MSWHLAARVLVLAAGLLLAASPGGGIEPQADSGERDPGRTLFVRQTVGDDTSDGLSPPSAWKRLSRLSRELQAGDTVYVGPGLYREELVVFAEGTFDHPIRLIADSEGLYTGDPPGVVMITGAESMDEGLFSPGPKPGVYSAPFADFLVSGVVEMDGPQLRYMRSRSTREHLQEGLSELEAVARLPSTYFYDRDAGMLHLHTSDGQSPGEHEIELMRRGSGITISGRRFLTVVGFTFRHASDAGIKISHGSTRIALVDNTSYGSRQGIRVRNSSEIVVAGNRLFRNENSGVYFLDKSLNGRAVHNTLYENAKGVRWGGESNGGLALGNTAFDNRDSGIAVESVAGAVIMRNRLIDNRGTQLLSVKSTFFSEGNCFATSDPGQLVANLSYHERFEVLTDYRDASGQDRSSRQVDCGPVPEATDVLQLHAETTGAADVQ